MKIVFWSNVHGQVATTSNMLAISITSVLHNNCKSFITQSQYVLNNLEKPIIGSAAKQLENQFSDIGVDSLSRYLKQGKLDNDIIEGCCISLLNQKLNMLPGTRKKELFESDLLKIIPSIITASEQYHDFIFVDTNAGTNLLEQADLIVVNLNQNKMIIDDYFKNYHFDEAKTFYLIGNYNYRSRFNLNNLIHMYDAFDKTNLGAVPYNVGYQDAQSNGEVIPYFLRNFNCSKDDCNFYFMNTIKKSSDLLIKKAKTNEMKVRRVG